MRHLVIVFDWFLIVCVGVFGVSWLVSNLCSDKCCDMYTSYVVLTWIVLSSRIYYFGYLYAMVSDWYNWMYGGGFFFLSHHSCVVDMGCVCVSNYFIPRIQLMSDWHDL